VLTFPSRTTKLNVAQTIMQHMMYISPNTRVRIVLNTLDCSGLIDLAFVLDSAGTVHPERWHYVTQFVVNIIQQLDIGLNRTRVAVITWSDTAHVVFTLDRFTDRQDVVQVILIH